MSGPAHSDALSPYVPRLLAEWDLRAKNSLWESIDATCCFVDISGFTALSECARESSLRSRFVTGPGRRRPKYESVARFAHT